MKRQISTAAGVYRHLIVPAPRLTADKQRERARQHVPLNAAYQEFNPTDREEWLTMSRPDDVLLVDQLELIPPPRRKGSGVPTAEFGEVRGWLKAHPRRIVECNTGAEPDAKRWRQALENISRGHRILVQGHLGTDMARKLGKRRGQQMTRESIVTYYREHPEHETFAAIWRGAKGDAVAALEALNAYLDKRRLPRLGSEASCRRAFDTRGKLKQKP